MVNRIQYLVITDVEAGFVNKTDVVRTRTFKEAVKLYRENTSIYGPFSCQIAKVVVDYGETL